MRHWRFEHVRDSALSLLGARALSFIAEIGTHASLCYSIHAPPLQEIVRFFFESATFYIVIFEYVALTDNVGYAAEQACVRVREESMRARESEIYPETKKKSL